MNLPRAEGSVSNTLQSNDSGKRLIVDAIPPELNSRWLIYGAVWAVLFAASLQTGIFLSQVFAAVGGLLVIFAAGGRRLPTPRRHPALAALVLVAAAHLLSSLFSDDPAASLRRLLSYYFLPLSGLIGILWLVRDERGFRWVTRSFLAAGAIGGLYGTFQFFTGLDPVYGQKIYHLMNYYEHLPFYRAQGLLHQSITFANVQMLLFVAGLPAAWYSRGKQAFFCWTTLAIIGVSILLAYQRSAWLGAVFAAGLFLVTRSRKSAIISLVSALALVSVLWLIPPMQERLINSFNPADRGASERYILWGAAFHMGVDHPLLGVGPGRWGAHASPYLPDPADWTWEGTGGHAHNDLLHVWATTGVAGTLTVIALIFVLVRAGWKELQRWKRLSGARHGYLGGILAVGALAVSSMFQCNLTDGEVALTLGMVLGIALAGRGSLIRNDETRSPAGKPTPFIGHLEEAFISARSIVGATVGFSYLRATLRAATVRDLLVERAIGPQGEELNCPYFSGRPQWAPVVLHLHSNRWEGAFTPKEIVEHYSSIGAGVVIITDHNRVTRVDHPASPLPAYEHGWGIHHHHVLVLGAERTRVERYPFGGPHITRRDTIARLREADNFLILAHPHHKGAWSGRDVAVLDYDAIEIFNKSCDDTVLWDEALTSGRLIWGTAGEDGHDLRSRHQTGKRYLLVDLREGSEADGAGDSFSLDTPALPLDSGHLLRSLRSGRFVSVHQGDRRLTRKLPPEDAIVIDSFQWDGERLKVVLEKPVEVAELIGPNGIKVEALHDCSTIELAPEAEHSYLRIILKRGVHTVALNPVTRRKKADLR